jgi:hypothetical protein
MNDSIEYPPLGNRAKELITRAREAAGFCQIDYYDKKDRRYLATVIDLIRQWSNAEEIALNLHNPVPPPTLAEAREAARQLAGPEAQVVHAFLRSLKEH